MDSNLIDICKNVHVSDVFRKMASQNRDKISAECADKKISYQQLDENSDRVANYLTNKISVKPNDHIALCIPKSIDLVIWILGVLKSGAIYLPILPEIPPLRLKEIFEKTECKFVVTTSHSKSIFDETIYSGLLIATDEFEHISNYETPSSKIPTIQRYDNDSNVGRRTCCTIFTSGTTGEPKGVLLSSQNIVHVALGCFSHLSLSKNDKYASFASIVFTVSLIDIFTALLNGMTLSIIPEEVRRNPPMLMDYVNEKKITCLHIPPSVLQQLPRNRTFSHTLTFLRCGGETCDLETLSHFSNLREVSSMVISYGLSESTAAGLMKKGWKIGDEPSNIGQTWGTYKCYILNEDMKPVSGKDEVGELFIESECGISNGYLDLPKQTNEKFISKNNERKLVRLRTGDFCHYNENGDVIYHCRIDNQVKIQGTRIDVLEIEFTVKNYLYGSDYCSEFVKDVVVCVKKDQLGNNRLVAFIVPNNNNNNLIIIENLKKIISHRLERIKVPTKFIILNSLPKTFSGKRDRIAIQKLPVQFKGNQERNQNSEDNYVTTNNETEKIILEIFENLLGVEMCNNSIGIHDDFYEIGGNSLLLSLLSNRIKERMNIKGNQFNAPKLLSISKLSVRTISNLLFQQQEQKDQKNVIVENIRKFRTDKGFTDWSSDPPIRYKILNPKTDEIDFQEVVDVATDSNIGGDRYLGNPMYLRFSNERKTAREWHEVFIRDMYEKGRLLVSKNRRTGEVLGCSYGFERHDHKKYCLSQPLICSFFPEFGALVKEVLGNAVEELGHETYYDNKIWSLGNATKYNAPLSTFVYQSMCMQELGRMEGHKFMLVILINPTTQKALKNFGVFTQHKGVDLVDEFTFEGKKVFQGIKEEYVRRVKEFGFLSNEKLREEHYITTVFAMSRKLDKPIEEVYNLLE